MNRLNPTDYAIHVFGGTAEKLADILGVTRQAVHRWSRSKGGRIPGAYFDRILGLARQFNVDFKAEDLVYGREVETLLQRVVKDGKLGYRWGDDGKFFSYSAGDEPSRRRAMTNAENSAKNSKPPA